MSNFRSRGRIPSAVWKHPDNGALLVRCAQPCVGITGNHCASDEQMLGAFKNSQQNEIYIMDSRPKTNAIANMLRGGGYEMAKYYKDIQLEFNNIDNIHVMRNSLTGVQKYCLTISLENINTEINEKNQPEELQLTRWLAHLRLVLDSVARVVELLHHNACSVVVHCSDGWDRTSQTVALAELLLDPYYRTIEGFLRLLEKDWIQFGHQFALRYGHSVGTMWNYKESQRSPIFPQFLDIIHQLIHLYPTKFEFNEELLLTLMEELYSCRFGTFLYDSQKQRLENKLFGLTKSLWPFILANKSFYTNQNYRHDPSILLLEMSNVNLRLWNNYFIRFQRVISSNPFGNDSLDTNSKSKNSGRHKKRVTSMDDRPFSLSTSTSTDDCENVDDSSKKRATFSPADRKKLPQLQKQIGTIFVQADIPLSTVPQKQRPTPPPRLHVTVTNSEPTEIVSSSISSNLYQKPKPKPKPPPPRPPRKNVPISNNIAGESLQLPSDTILQRVKPSPPSPFVDKQLLNCKRSYTDPEDNLEGEPELESFHSNSEHSEYSEESEESGRFEHSGGEKSEHSESSNSDDYLILTSLKHTGENKI